MYRLKVEFISQGSRLSSLNIQNQRSSSLNGLNYKICSIAQDVINNNVEIMT